MTDPMYLSVEEVAQRFAVHPTTIYRMAKHGALPALKIGGQWRFSEEMLGDWVADRVTIERLKAEDQKGES